MNSLEKIPFLGLCFGMQLAVIEFARNVCGLKEANSVEFVIPLDQSKKSTFGEISDRQFVIDVLPEQKALLREKKYGGTMRLGAYRCKIEPKTRAFSAYQSNFISERHRHRYELNNEFRRDS